MSGIERLIALSIAVALVTGVPASAQTATRPDRTDVAGRPAWGGATVHRPGDRIDEWTAFSFATVWPADGRREGTFVIARIEERRRGTTTVAWADERRCAGLTGDLEQY